MNSIDALIKKLEEAKEELSKGVNCAPGAQQNTLVKDAANPALAPKEVKVKELQAKIDAGTYKPDPKAIADKMIGKADEDHPTTLSHGDVKKLIKEELTCSENGQWTLNKAYADPSSGISHIEHHDEGGINSTWHIHMKDGSKKTAHSTDGESPVWAGSDKPVADTHPHIHHALNNTWNYRGPENHLHVTHHESTGKLIKPISSKKI